MPRQTLYSGRPGAEYSDAWWTSVHRLYDDCFPGLTAGIAAASAIGIRWRDVTTPFALFEDDRAVAHVGVLDHPIRLLGRTVHVAGVHAVCTAPARRREGLSKIVLSEALSWADERFSSAKLNTDLAAVYSGHGFRVVPTCRFETAPNSGRQVSKRLLAPTKNPEDARLLADLFGERIPPSDVCSTADSGWMATIVAALNGGLDSTFWFLEDCAAVVALAPEDDRTLVADVVAKTLPPLEAVAGAAPDPSAPLAWTFSPELFSTDATATLAPEKIGCFMVRGNWPVDEPFGISPLWEH